MRLNEPLITIRERTVLSLAANIFLAMVLFGIMCGCASQSKNVLNAEAKDQGASGYMQVDFTLNKPEYPGLPIYVNQIGFVPDADKILIFSEDVTKEMTFEIVNADTHKIAYTGSIMKTAANYGYGEFSVLKAEGNYYARVRGVGESGRFQIGKDVYNDTLKSLTNMNQAAQDEIFGTKTGKSLEWDCLYTLQGLLFLKIDKARTANALYADTPAADALQKAAGRLMKSESGDYRQSLCIVGTMCCLSQYFKLVNEELSLQLSQKAEELSDGLLNNGASSYGGTGDSVYEYFAFTALYSLTGNDLYHKKIKEITLGSDAVKGDAALTLWRLMGDYNYLSAYSVTDPLLCEAVISSWQNEVSMVLGSPIHIQEHLETHDFTFALIDSVYLFLMDYILSGNEYAHIQTNITDYYAGRNSSFIDSTKMIDGNARVSAAWEREVYLFIMNK